MGSRDRLFIFLYTDEDVTHRLAGLLRERGYEAESARGAGTIGFSDEEHLAFAARQGWTILTCNRKDFVLLAQRWQASGLEHGGIVISRQLSNQQTGELLRRACSLIDTVTAEEMWNTVLNLQSFS